MKKSGINTSIIHKFVLFIAAISTIFSVSAYDFEVDGIYYDKISDTSVEVTHDGSLDDNNGAGYSGNVTIPETIEINGITYIVCGIGRHAFYDTAGLTSVSIPASVSFIGEGAFGSCTDLASVSIPASVTSIGEYAFRCCTSLTSVSIPEGITSIAQSVFSGCSTLTSVNIPEGVVSIDNYAFYSCTGLTSVTIPASVTSIGEGAFSDCTGLTEIVINENSPNYASSDGVLFNKTYTDLILCPAGKAGIYNIPEGVTSIDTLAFAGCTGLTSVTIPASVTSIGEGAFSDCIGMTSVNIPEGVTSIGDGVFSGCISLTSVFIPEGVISIDNYAFYGCTGLTFVTIPASVTSIGECAFRGCTGLTSVAIPEGVASIGDSAFWGCTGLTSVAIPASVASISEDAFRGCTGLTSVIIPASVTSISDGTFRGCTGLTYVAIPASVTSIGVGAFRDCTGLASVFIPEGVTSIGDYAFYYCMALNKVICFAETVPTFGYSVFIEVPTTCSVYVPSGTRNSYASSDELASYTIKEFGLTVTPAELELEVGATAELTASYTVDGSAETEKEISSVLGTNFIWSSSAKNVAAVSTSGQVTARNAGTAEVKAITPFGNTVFATSTVNVGTSGILDVSADGIRISTTSGKIMIENIGENQKVYAYTTSGICHIFQESNGGTVEIPAETGKIYIIVVDGFATKVLAK